MIRYLNKYVVVILILGVVTLWSSEYERENIVNNDDRTLDGSRNIELIARSLYGPAQCVTVNNNLSYTGAGSALLIHDISNPAAPELIGSVYTPGVLNGVDYKKNIIYAADGPAGIASINVREPSDPELLDILDIDGWVEELDVSGRYAYLAAGDEGLKIIDISNPRNLIQVGELELDDYCRDIMVQGDYAYICGGNIHTTFNCHLWVVDISNPSSPKVVFHYINTGGYGPYTGLFVDGHFLYATTYGNIGQVPYFYLDIWDVGDPNAPQLRNHFLITNVMYAVDIKISHGFLKTYAYIVCEEFGLIIVDVTSSDKPSVVSHFTLPPSVDKLTWMEKLCVAGNYIYAAGDWLWIIDATEPPNPMLAGYYDTGASAAKVNGPHDYISPADDICGIAYTWNSLHLINVSNPYSPYPLGTLLLEQRRYAFDVCLSYRYKYAYLTCPFDSPDYFLVCNIENPYLPDIVGNLTISDPYYLYQVNNYVYLNSMGYFRIIDVSVPENPIELGNYEVGTGMPGDLYVTNNIAYVSNLFQGLIIVNVNDPYNPMLLGLCSEVQPRDVFVKGNYAYIAHGHALDEGGLAVVDVQNPSDPQLVAYFDFGCIATGVYVYDNICYLTDMDGLKVIDISDPLNPVLVDCYYMPVPATDVHCARGYAYVTVGRCGLYILRFNPSGSPIVGPQSNTENEISGKLRLQVQNPAVTYAKIIYELPYPSEAKIKIYDASGSVIHEFDLGKKSAGINAIIWDGRDNCGHQVSSGIYFVQLETSINTVTAKIILTR